MKEKLTMSNYLTYLVTGYIWIATFLLLINLIQQFGLDFYGFFNETTVLISPSFSYALVSIPFAFVVGVAFKPFAEGLNNRMGRLLLGTEKDIRVDNELRVKITEKAVKYSAHRDYYELLEYQLDDLLSVFGIRNSWSKHYYLAELMKHVYLSGVFFSILVMINLIMIQNIYLFTVTMLSSIFFLYACRLSYIANMKNYITEVQMSFMFFHCIHESDTTKNDIKERLYGNSTDGVA